MSMLVILLAPRSREAAAAPVSAGLSHVWSADGVAIGVAGRCEASEMPKADMVVAVLSALDVAWHRVSLPRAPDARLRQALSGVLEEQLLEDPDQVHLALAPLSRAGEQTWVAAMHKPWLSQQLATLAAAGVVVDQVVCAYAPASAAGGQAQGHFFTGADAERGSADDLWLAWGDAQGALCLRITGSLAREWLPQWAAQQPRWSATPGAAAQAERWLDAAVNVQSDGEHALAAARSGWNLRQFDLRLHSRGLRALRDAGRHLLGPAWRPLRWGVAALLGLQLLGLNAWAWQLQRAVDAKRGAISELLRSSHPKVRSVLDAPLQMQRETDQLRSAAGRAGDDDFETLLALAAAAWPEGRPPVEQLRFEPGRLYLPASGWAPEQLQQLRSRIEQAGGQLASDDAQLTLSRSAQKAVP